MSKIYDHAPQLELFSPADLRALGMDEIAYVKKYKMNGKDAWVVHAADGTALSVQHNREDAAKSADMQDLDIIAVH